MTREKPAAPVGADADTLAEIDAAEVGVATGGDPLMPAAAGEAAPPTVQFLALGKSAIVVAAAAILSKAVSFVMLPLYTRYLSPADYGALEMIELSLDLMTIAAGSRLLGGVFRFYFKAKSEESRRSVISTAIWTVCAGYAVIGGLALLGAPLIARLVLGGSQYTRLVQLGALAAATSAPTFVPTPYLRANGRFGLVVGAQLARLAIQVGLNILLLTVVHLGPEAMFLSTITANLCLGSVMVWLVLREVGTQWAAPVARQLYRFGLPLIATQVATFILTFGDRYFLRQATSLDAVGRYTLAYQFAFLLAMLTQQPFEMVWDPKRHEIAKLPRSQRDPMYARMFVYSNCVLLTGAVGIALFVRCVLQMLTRPNFWAAADVVPLLLPAIVLQAWAASHDIGILVRERTRWIAIANWAGAGTVLIAYALLIPKYAAWGAAIATVVGYAVRYVLIFTTAQRMWPVQYAWGPVVRLAALAVGTVCVGLFLPAGPLALALVTRLALLAVYLWLAWTLPILSVEDRASVRRLIARSLEAVAALLKRGTPASVAP